jgi:hypothetical protein
MSITINSGDPIAFTDTKYYGLSENKNGSQYIKSNQTLSLAPLEGKRTKVFIAGPTGCGKTYFAMSFLKNYQRVYPDNDIIIITADVDDETIHSFQIDNVKMLDLSDPDLAYDDDLFEEENYRNCCVFFDDLDYLKTNTLTKKFAKLKTNLLGVGRHYNTSVVMTSHLVMNYQKTRFILSESDYIVIYPNSGSTRFINNFFRIYFSGLREADKSRIRQSGSRWVACRMVFPQAYITDKEIRLVK